MSGGEFEIGMVGLGVMGRNLLLNMAGHGYSVAGFDRDPDKLRLLAAEAGSRDVRGAGSLEEFVALLRVPRAVMMLVPAGPPVDAVIRDLLPHLVPGDLIIDGGNSHFTDTNLREKTLADRGILYMGMGISGGEHGARHGPCLMPGGPREAYDRVRPLLDAVAARVDGEPCVAYLGPGSAGHYVKMVHNGIEYGLMQMIAESYDLMKQGLGLDNDELHAVYDQWNREDLNSYLMEITARIFLQGDERTGGRLIDVIQDEASQKGTGMWTSQDAAELQVPIPTIDVALSMRNLSAINDLREEASKLLAGPNPAIAVERGRFLADLRNAVYSTMILTYSQGFSHLQAASAAYGYDLDLEVVARIWRGGCIIRAALLEEVRRAFERDPRLPSLLMDSELGQRVVRLQGELRSVTQAAVAAGIPAPALHISLSYFDGYRSAWLPANLVQAQRDYFGAHTYERVDARGTFHTQWEKE